MTMIKICLISLALFSVVQAQTVSLGSCDNQLETVENFRVDDYLGTWYEYKRSFFVFEALGRCNTAFYEKNEDGSIRVVNSQINQIFGTPLTATAKAVPDDIDRGKLNVTFDTTIKFPGSSPYWILNTDYTNYAVVYSCSNYANFKGETAWILTRERQPTDEIIQTAEQVITDRKITITMKVTKQNDCEKLDNNDEQ